MSTQFNTGGDTQAISTSRPLPAALKQFQLEGLLGEGGMGLVYRAQDSRLHRPVAVKVLSTDLTLDPDRKQRFLQEARAAARISHPAVAQIFDADEQDGITFIVMELIEGKTLRQLIEEQSLDLLGTMDVAIQAAEGLARAHDLGIVHRDIKPANLMRTADGHVKILDFGLAKLLDPTGAGSATTERLRQSQLAHTRSGVVMGTPAYMSPEQVRGLPVDFRADIFALGVLIFEMATGTSPFQRDNFVDALHAAAFEDTPPMNSVDLRIPDGLQRIVTRCLRKKPEDRYPNARALADDLRRLRKDTESGLAQKTSWRQKILERWDELRTLPPSHYWWYGIGLTAGVLLLYFSVERIGVAGLFFLSLGALYVFRHVRNRRHRVQDAFVRRVRKFPEVRLISIQHTQVKVVVDQPVAQLYGRINDALRTSNARLYYGEPMTVSILHEVSAEQYNQLLAEPGVHYVREQ